MKVIFLDIDGVCNNHHSRSRCQGYIGIDDDKVVLLKQIADATDAKIVLSSTWRLGYNKQGHHLEKMAEYLKKKFAKQGLSVYDVTPDFKHMGWKRGEEILDWLVKHPDVEKYVILDDEDYDFRYIGPEITDHWVQTEYYSKDGGLQPEHVEKAIKILNGEVDKG